MIIQQAIQKAIENGYKDKTFNLETIIQDDMLDSDIINRVLLDRDFWIALGKGMRWEYGDFQPLKNMHQMNVWEGEQWLYEWHHFIDDLAEDKSIVDFFAQLNEPK
ncbi:MAG: hypothetical protein AABY15_03400 [Nanoarchaeota archaeon]